MEDFRIIYKILRILQKAMDLEEFDSEGRTGQRNYRNSPVARR